MSRLSTGRQFASTPLGRSHSGLQLHSVTKHVASGYSEHEAPEHGSVGQAKGDVTFSRSNGWPFLHVAILPRESKNTGNCFPHLATTVQNESSTPSHERPTHGFVESKLKGSAALFTYAAVVRSFCSEMLLFTSSLLSGEDKGLLFERIGNATATITRHIIPEDIF